MRCRGSAVLRPGVTGPGGGDTGTVLLSPCIAPGTVSETVYNHYSMLGSVENLFGLAHLDPPPRAAALGSPFATTTTVVPSGARPAKGYYSPHWRTVRRHGAWQGRASRRALVAIKLRAGVHHLKLRVLGGLVALEGYGISARTG